jgi:hypothetical protein
VSFGQSRLHAVAASGFARPHNVCVNMLCRLHPFPFKPNTSLFAAAGFLLALTIGLSYSYIPIGFGGEINPHLTRISFIISFACLVLTS